MTSANLLLFAPLEPETSQAPTSSAEVSSGLSFLETCKITVRKIAALAGDDGTSRLAEKNLLAVRQLDGLAAKVDAAYAAGNETAARRHLAAWRDSWKFWLKAIGE